jgi:hypothetical protein
MALIALEFRGLPFHDPFHEPEQLPWRLNPHSTESSRVGYRLELARGCLAEVPK